MEDIKLGIAGGPPKLKLPLLAGRWKLPLKPPPKPLNPSKSRNARGSLDDDDDSSMV